VAAALVVEVFVRELVMADLKVDGWKTGRHGRGAALGSDLHAEVRAFSGIEPCQK
jgi:hypothetical protein